ncbi:MULTISPECIES: GNAT family N-acetyltransferase [unclassified Streptomyces]|uniref:GNAT family N-acetyltransferase n=1 Tax=unclassified Streptomyces TaxID=2593676 RepID=UPI00380EEC11
MTETRWRPLALTDAPRLAEMLSECAVADGGTGLGTDDVREALSAPGIDLGTGSTSLWCGGAPAAHATVRAREHGSPAHRMTLDLAVRPAYRTPSLVRLLLDRCRTLALRRHGELYPGAPLELHVRTRHGQAWLVEALDATGYRRERAYWSMRLELGASGPRSVPVPTTPQGTTIVPFDDTFDGPLLELRNEVFTGNWGSVPMTPRTWRRSVTGSAYFRPASSFLLLSDRHREILCYLLCTEPTDGRSSRELYLANAGTRTALHGRGLYRAVFTHALVRARADGYHRAVLDVDATNPMASGGFYGRMGFRRCGTWTTHVLPVTAAPPGGGGPSAPPPG